MTERNRCVVAAMRERFAKIAGAALFALAAGLVAPAIAQASRTPTVAELVAAMRHAATLIRTVEYDYQLTTFPTDPETMKLLQRFMAEKSRRMGLTYSGYSPSRAARMSWSGTWCRKGVKEAITIQRSGREEVQCADGQFLRRLAEYEDGPRGLIMPVTDNRWKGTPRPTLFWALHEESGVPFWQLLERAQDVVITQNGSANHFCEVRLTDPDFPNSTAAFRFNSELRLLYRELGVKFPGDEQVHLARSYRVKQYQAFDDESGEKIWYPTAVTHIDYAGQLRDGTPVPFKVEEWILSNVRFNHPIPDERFVIQFPAGCKVYDMVNRLGLIDQSTAAALPSPPRASTPAARPASVWLILLGAANVAMVLGVGVALWLRRRRASLVE